MKKCLSLLIALTMILSIVVFPVSTQAATPDIPKDATLIFAEDFEEGYVSGNLLDASTTTVDIANSSTGKKVLQFDYKDTTKQSATVEAGPAEFNTSKVLKLSSSDTSNALVQYIYFNGGSNFSWEYDSKQIVVEYDILIDPNGVGLKGSNSFMSPARWDEPSIKNSFNDKGLAVQTGTYTEKSYTSNLPDKDWYVRKNIPLTSSKTIKYVIEKNITDFDSIRVYADNVIQKKAFDVSTEWNTGKTVKDYIGGANHYVFNVNSYADYAKNKYPDVNFSQDVYGAPLMREDVEYPSSSKQCLYTSFTPAAAGTATIYLDNIKVYAVEPIKFVEIGTKTNVQPETGVQVTFDQPFNATTSTFAVSLASDETNAWIDGAIEDVEMSDDKKTATVKFKASALKGETEYKIWVDDEFTSAAGAVYHKDLDGVLASEEYIFLDSFTTSTKFEIAEIINSAITEFDKGRSAESVITLTKPVNPETVASAFKVVDGAGNEVATGWTATLSNENKTITLDFSGLEKANYTITTDELEAADGDKLENAEIVTITAKGEPIVLFDEDFEGTGDKAYALDTNWFDTGKLPANGKFSIGAYNNWGSTSTTIEGASVTVTKSLPAGVTSLSGSALKIFIPGDKGNNVVKVKANSQLGAIDIDDEKYKNKVIVYEGDMFVVNSVQGNSENDSRMFAPSFNNNMNMTLFHTFNGNSIGLQGLYLDTPNKTHTANRLHQRWTITKPIAKNGSKVQMVIDQRSGLDTAKIIVDETQFTETNHTLLADHPNFNKTFYEFPMAYNDDSTNAFAGGDMGSFYGFFLVAKAGKGSGNSNIQTTDDAEVYYDNLKAYLVDAFEIESVEGVSTAFNPIKDTIKINFTNKISSLENAKDNISVVDVVTGNPVDVSVTLADGDYQAVVDLPDDATNGEYKIVVSPMIMDEYGITLASKWEYHPYTSTVGEGWAVLKSNGQVASLHATEAEAEAAKGESYTVQKYTWTANGAGEVDNFTISATTATNPATFYANGYVRDDVGMNLETVIKTAKSISLYAEATDTKVTDENVKTKLTLVNPVDATLGVWYIVAAYGQYNEMLGCKAGTIDGGMAKGEKVIDINFNAKSSDIKSVKVYIWDSYKSMIPYHDAETIFGG